MPKHALRGRCTMRKAIALCAIAAVTGCESGADTRDEAATQFLEPALAVYRKYKLDDALSLFEAAVADNPESPDAHAWLAETARRLRQYDLAEREANLALALDPCHSFAHTVLGDAYRPELSGWENANHDSSWRHLLEATECNPDDGNPWISVWSGAMGRGERDLEERALRQLIETGFLTPSVLEFNRWLLRSLPNDAILITNGDWDTFPSLAVQLVEGLRRDVGITNRSMLNLSWYARLMAGRYGVSLPMSDAAIDEFAPFRGDNGSIVTVSDEIIGRWMDAGSVSGRPLVFAVTVDMHNFSSGPKLRFAGPFWKLEPDPGAPAIDTDLVKAALDDIAGRDLSSPEVSSQDRSAVRIFAASNRSLVLTVLGVSSRGVTALLEVGRVDEAEEMVNWMEEFAVEVGLDEEQHDLVDQAREVVRGAR